MPLGFIRVSFRVTKIQILKPQEGLGIVDSFFYSFLYNIG